MTKFADTLVVHCVTIATNHLFSGNLIAEQHRLRHKELIEKEQWSDIYVQPCGETESSGNMEFDRYDNLATEYFIACDQAGRVVGVTRSYPTTLPYMISEVFNHLAVDGPTHSEELHELSRLAIDRDNLSNQARIDVIDALLLSVLERGLQRGIKNYITFSYPGIWKITFERLNWPMTPAGKERRLADGKSVRAGFIHINQEVATLIKQNTSITHEVLSFGEGQSSDHIQGAVFSPGTFV